MSLPYTDLARAKGWTPRGWFGLTEPQQARVLGAKSLGLDWSDLGPEASDFDLPEPTVHHNVTVHTSPGTALLLAALTAWVVLS